jgi:mono/diheme cytochrome c family protein
LLLSTAAVAPAIAVARGDYAASQANAGQQLFAQHCAKCHGSNLEGEAGPPLAGPKFASNLAYSKISAPQLFDFIETQMPADAPGSLTKQQYEQAFAYILSRNGYPAGATPLNEATIGRIKLLPYPGRGRP